jgi:hypothetical protein
MAVNSATGLTAYAVPTGDTAILKHMSFWVPANHGPYTPESFITVALDEVNVIVWDINGSTVRKGVYQWSGWEVFTSALYLRAVASPFSFRASGSLLTPT